MPKSKRTKPGKLGIRGMQNASGLKRIGAVQAGSNQTQKTLEKAFARLQQGKLSDADTLLKRVLKKQPNNFDALHLSGIVKAQLGKFSQAITLIRRALEIKPDDIDALNNMGNSLRQTGDDEAAILVYRRALELKPDFAGAYNNLGMALRNLNREKEAFDCFNRSLDINPNQTEAYNNIALILMERKQYQPARDCFAESLKLNPNQSQAITQNAMISRQICDWTNFNQDWSDLTRHLKNTNFVPAPITYLSFSDNPEDQLLCAQRYAGTKSDPIEKPVIRNSSSTDDHIRIAYVSGDYRRHPVAFHIAELIELHNRDRFEVIGVSHAKDDESEIRKRLEQGFDDFIDVRSLQDRQAAELIAEHKIHIAVDLSGYAEGRPGILAHRPAPIQVNYLGYSATMGADFIDYILVDRFLAPAEHQPYYSENLVHVSDCYMVNDRKREIAQKTPSRTQAGLPEDGFVFCCLNNAFKYTPAVFDIWMRLLKDVPGSVLWLRGENEWMEENLRREAQARGMAADRLIFASQVKSAADYLSRLRLADLFLDTHPYNAHATACDALWAGLPVLTCPGNTFASRVAGSLLHAVELPELVTGSLEDYEALALKLARDPGLLGDLRAKLARNRDTTALFDTDRFCGNLEAAYEEMFKTWRAGKAPHPISVELEPLNP